MRVQAIRESKGTHRQNLWNEARPCPAKVRASREPCNPSITRSAPEALAMFLPPGRRREMLQISACRSQHWLGAQSSLLCILGMAATCLAALSGQPPKPEGARPSARG